MSRRPPTDGRALLCPPLTKRIAGSLTKLISAAALLAPDLGFFGNPGPPCGTGTVPGQLPSNPLSNSPPSSAGPVRFFLSGRLRMPADLRTTVVIDYQDVHLVGHSVFDRHLPKHET
jgi:hypothetical protein